MKFVSFLLACLAAVALAADDTKECEGEWIKRHELRLSVTNSRVIGVLFSSLGSFLVSL